METLQAIHTRKSVRDFQDKSVPMDMIATILEAGARAPSGGNMQPWRFVVVTDRQKMMQFDPEFHQPWVENAPAMIVACVDPHDTWASYDEDDHFYVFDIAAAIQNMLLAIHDLGLGAVWVLSCSKKTIRRLLEVPKHWQIIALIPFGYIATDVAGDTGDSGEEEEISLKKPLTEVAFLNTAKSPSPGAAANDLSRTEFDGP